MKIARNVLLTLIGLALLVLLRQEWMLAFFAILLCVIYSFPVRFMSKKLPRGLAVVLTLLMGGAITAAVGYFTVQPITGEVQTLYEKAPAALAKVKHWMHKIEPKPQTSAEKSAPQPTEQIAGKVVEQTGKITLGAVSVLSMIIIVVVLGAFFVHEPKSYLTGILALVPKKYEGETVELWNRLSAELQNWMKGILIAMAIMGGFCALGLKVVGLENWFLLGLLTFFATFIPYAGAISSAVPGLILGLAQSFPMFLKVGAVYLGVHIIEGYIVQPLIMKKAVVIRPATLLIWQIVMATFGGILGIMVATPLLVCVKVIVNYLYIEKKLHKDGRWRPKLAAARAAS